MASATPRLTVARKSAAHRGRAAPPGWCPPARAAPSASFTTMRSRSRSSLRPFASASPVSSAKPTIRFQAARRAWHSECPPWVPSGSRGPVVPGALASLGSLTKVGRRRSHHEHIGAREPSRPPPEPRGLHRRSRTLMGGVSETGLEMSMTSAPRPTPPRPAVSHLPARPLVTTRTIDALPRRPRGHHHAAVAQWPRAPADESARAPGSVWLADPSRPSAGRREGPDLAPRSPRRASGADEAGLVWGGRTSRPFIAMPAAPARRRPSSASRGRPPALRHPRDQVGGRGRHQTRSACCPSRMESAPPGSHNG